MTRRRRIGCRRLVRGKLMATTQVRTANRSQDAPRAYVFLTLAILIPLSVVLITYAVTQLGSFRSDLGELLLWTAGLAILNLLPIPMKDGLTLAPDIPVGIAICIVLHPLSAALVGMVASFDTREFSERKFVVRSLYNRCNQSLGLLLAGLAVQRVSGHPHTLARLAAASILAYVVWSTENYLVIAVGRAVHSQVPFLTTFRQLHVGKATDYILSLLAWCIIAAFLAWLYERVGPWAVPAFLLVSIIVRQMLVRSDSVIQREAELEEQRSLVKGLSQRMATERQDERARIASYLHDEVIQALFQASLLCQVVSLDVSTGRLLDLDADVPAAQAATEAAVDCVREVIRDLRSSAIGPRGVSSSLKALIRDSQASVPVTIADHVADLSGLDPELQLIAYQVGREALTNALYHARSKNIEVSLQVAEDTLELTVLDDGVGFDLAAVREDHFGLLLMEERTESVGGVLYVDSDPGRGTAIRAQFPLGSRY
jgi:signal transduction histidine kinase